MDAVAVDVIVLNYNGGSLPDECLPSIVRATAASRHHCRLIVVDNSSTDGSAERIAERFPSVELRRLPNRGLCSLNDVLRDSTARVAVLLNNDVKAADDALDPLLEPLLDPDAFDEPVAFAAPRCRLFDGVTHEGFKTAVRRRFGMVQATALFAGAEGVAATSGPTASAGAVLAVDRTKFVELGGFDAAYLPGRIEDLDFCYRAFLAGYQGRYVAESQFLHRGGATFHAAFGRRGCDQLALRNTLIFQWRRLRCLEHAAATTFWTAVRAVRDIAWAPFVVPDARFEFCRAWREARRIHRSLPAANHAPHNAAREREFFRRHAPGRLLEPNITRAYDAEAARDERHPISRWYLRPAACAVAARLAQRGVSPNLVTACGLLLAVLAAALIVAWPTAHLPAALILAAWFCDRVDGPLARLGNRATPLGAWIDANVDEVVDLGLHTATAAAAAACSESTWPWICLIGFLIGKYLLMHGLASHDEVLKASADTERRGGAKPRGSLWRTLYHAPANADVRVHLLIVAVASGCLTAELAFIAVYYNVRWIARYFLLARRMARATTAGVAT